MLILLNGHSYILSKSGSLYTHLVTYAQVYIRTCRVHCTCMNSFNVVDCNCRKREQKFGERIPKGLPLQETVSHVGEY